MDCKKRGGWDEKRNIATNAAPALALSDKTFNRGTRDLFGIDPYFPLFLFSLSPFRVNVIRDRWKSDGKTYVFSPKCKTNCDSKYCASVAVNKMQISACYPVSLQFVAK